MKLPQDFEMREDGVRITSLVLAATVFFDRPMREVSAELLAAWGAWLNWCPPQCLKFYSTETMSEHKPATPKTLSMLPAWFSPTAPARPIVSFEIKDGKTFDETPHWLFDLVGIEGDIEEPSILQIAVPYDADPAIAHRLRAFTGALIARLDASHAVAGLALLCSPYEEELSQSFARAKSMRHRGVDILLREADRVTVGHDGIKGVNWLTFVDAARVERLGGEVRVRAALDPAIGLVQINGGLLLQAGAAPELGDENRRERLPLYRNVFGLLEPLTVDAFERSLELVLDDMEEAEQLSLQWRRRLAP
jgi:hypothetical protein